MKDGNSKDGKSAPEQAQSPTASVRTLRSFVLPLATFYARSIRPRADGEPGPVLSDDERYVLADAASKLVAESEGLLRSLRTGTDMQFSKAMRDPESGVFPEPSLALVGEVLAAAGVLPRATRSKQEVELQMMEMEIERERLSLERQRLNIIQEQVVRGGRVTDPGPLKVVRLEPVPRQLMRAEAPKQKVSAFTKIDKEVTIDEVEVVEAKAAPARASAIQWSGVWDCLRVALCDLILCFLDLVCVNGKFNFDAFDDDKIGDQLRDCVGVFICTALRCFVDVLCPPDPQACIPMQQPCNLAVEEY